jgi:phosphohistidine swiveling domain-containing protein
VSDVIWLDPAAAAAPIGGKARSLLRLAAAGLPVPPALVVTAELDRDLPGDFEGALAAGLRALDPDPAARFSVRSSAEIEDRGGALGAGIFASRVGVARADVAAAAREVLASARAPGALAYAARRGLEAADLRMAVLIHPYTPGDAAGTAAFDPAAQREPLIELAEGSGGELHAAARAAVEGAARALAAADGAVEIEWVATDDAVRFLQLRPYQAPRPARWSGDAELAALPGGPWRWDAAHNPLPLSPAQAGLVAFVDGRCRLPFRQRVVRGYLFVSRAEAPTAPPPLVDPRQALAGLDDAFEQRAPPANLEEVLTGFAAIYEPLYAVVQPAAVAARAALGELLRAAGRPEAELGALLAGAPSLAAERAARAGDVAAYLALFGDEAPVWDVAVPTYAEDPSPIAHTHPSVAARAPAPPVTPPAWRPVLAAAREAAAVLEDDDVLYARVQAAVRDALLCEGERLRARGVLERADDVFWLPLEDVRRDARGEAPLAPAQAARAVAEARATHARALADPPPLGAPGANAGEGLARGLGASSGRAVGRVHLYPSAAAPAPDAVVIARTLLPTELPLIACAALVVETGGALDHVAAQARERGVPAVVGAAGACAAFRDGERVLVDGDLGLVVRL